MQGHRGQSLQPVPERRVGSDAGGRRTGFVTGLAVALVVAAGLAGAVQAAVMGELGGRVGVFPALAFSGIIAVVIGLALLLVAKQSLRGLADVGRQPVWLWSGGALSVL